MGLAVVRTNLTESGQVGKIGLPVEVVEEIKFQIIKHKIPNPKAFWNLEFVF